MFELIVKLFSGQVNSRKIRKETSKVRGINLSEQLKHDIRLEDSQTPTGVFGEQLQQLVNNVFSLKNRPTENAARPLHTPRSKYERFL